MSTESVSPQARFFQWVQGWATLMFCHSLVKAGVFEQMDGQSRTVDEIAEACHLHRDTLYRALRMMTVLDITTRESDRYTLTPLGQAATASTAARPGTKWPAWSACWS